MPEVPAAAGRVSPVDRLVPFARHAFPAALLFLGLLHVIFGERLTRMLPVWPDGLPGRPWWAHGAGVLLAVVSAVVLAPWLLGAFMLGSAYMHVRYAEFVARLMQSWMPWRVLWTYFAGVALAAGALGLLIPRTARLAALLTSLMIFLWFFLVHIPRMLIDPTGPVGWSEMAESLAFSALAFLLATRPPLRSVAQPPNVVSIGQAADRLQEEPVADPRIHGSLPRDR